VELVNISSQGYRAVHVEHLIIIIIVIIIVIIIIIIIIIYCTWVVTL